MSMDRLRVAVVGVGHLGQHHARILAAHPDVELVAVADSRPEQARTIAEKNGSQAVDDYRCLLDRVDAVSVAVPTIHHREVAGAFLAAALLRASLGNIADMGATLPSGSQGQSFLWELVMSAFLMFVILAVATDTRAIGEAAAIAIGATVGLDAIFGGPISGASMNPARSIAPAFVSGDLHALWLYIVAPVIGAALGALAYQFIRGEETLSGGADSIT